MMLRLSPSRAYTKKKLATWVQRTLRIIHGNKMTRAANAE
jgi:hypothetical protein